uniref:HMG box domain-containing protein n=1 Tax=Amblyomma maculatum TaxID=34609 RepID=G3MRW5_AMBMU
MAGTSAKANPPRPRKRVEVDTMKRARDGSAFTRCEVCNKDVPVVLIDMHSCSLDSKIRMNLEAQVVEKETEVKNKPVERKRAAPSENKERKVKKGKKNVNTNKPKRAPTAFFLFMDDFRKEYKELHPDNKSVASVAKEGGERWRSMTIEEKKPYTDRAAELKAEYVKEIEEKADGGEEVKENEKEQEEEVEEENEKEDATEENEEEEE